jgi:hypothetical protein
MCHSRPVSENSRAREARAAFDRAVEREPQAIERHEAAALPEDGAADSWSSYSPTRPTRIDNENSADARLEGEQDPTPLGSARPRRGSDYARKASRLRTDVSARAADMVRTVHTAACDAERHEAGRAGHGPGFDLR